MHGDGSDRVRINSHVVTLSMTRYFKVPQCPKLSWYSKYVTLVSQIPHSTVTHCEYVPSSAGFYLQSEELPEAN